jgi:ubiquinone/menaquinone biosynthesis C-methylase UbiE
MLDLGCGEGITDLGFLEYQLKQIYGLDITSWDLDHLNRVIKKIKDHGFKLSNVNRFKFIHYDGKHFPIPDASIDIIFSQGVFENVQNIPLVLREMHRVLRSDGFCYVYVFPWFKSRYGSHLTDYINDPYYHLQNSPEEVEAKLKEYDEDPQFMDYLFN